MCSTHTRDIESTIKQIQTFQEAGAGIVRLAVDSPVDAAALKEIRSQTSAVLAVDLQENYRLAEKVAPFVDKIRYNPGHLYHHEPQRSVREKVASLIRTAQDNGCMLRIGVNSGSVDPAIAERFVGDRVGAMVESAFRHCELMEELGFTNYVVSLKDSNPHHVIEANRRFHALRSDVPLHLGVTEAGLPPEGIYKTRRALGPLLMDGIGDTLRISLTLPNEKKVEEVHEGHQLLSDVIKSQFNVPPERKELNIIACPSCSRVENEAFVELAEQVRAVTKYAAQHDITIAVMGCRVNGPGETDHADIGLWCGPTAVHLKRGQELVGIFSYGEIINRLHQELRTLI